MGLQGSLSVSTLNHVIAISILVIYRLIINYNKISVKHRLRLKEQYPSQKISIPCHKWTVLFFQKFSFPNSYVLNASLARSFLQLHINMIRKVAAAVPQRARLVILLQHNQISPFHRKSCNEDLKSSGPVWKDLSKRCLNASL